MKRFQSALPSGSLSVGDGGEAPSPSKASKLCTESHSRSRSSLLLAVLRICSDELLGRLDQGDLANLSRTSPLVARAVVDWLKNPRTWTGLFIPDLLHEIAPGSEAPGNASLTIFIQMPESADTLDSILARFSELGRLFNQASCFLRTEERIELAWSTVLGTICLRRSYPLGVSHNATEMKQDGECCQVKSAFLAAYVTGWSKGEIRRMLLHLLSQNKRLRSDLSKFYRMSYRLLGKNNLLEQRIRVQLYCGYWQEVPESSRFLWLDLWLSLLSSDDVGRKAKLVFLVFGPVKSLDSKVLGVKIWTWDVRDETAIPDGIKSKTEQAFQPLAHAVGGMSFKSEDCLYDFISRLFKVHEELVDWNNQDRASFLLLLPRSVATVYLTLKAKDDSSTSWSLDLCNLLAEMLIQAEVLLIHSRRSEAISLMEKAVLAVENGKRRKVVVDGLWSVLGEFLLLAPGFPAKRTILLNVIEHLGFAVAEKAYVSYSGKKTSRNATRETWET